MRAANWRACGSWWHPRHCFEAARKSTFFRVVSRVGGRWQSAHATPRWAPIRGNLVFEWSKRFNSFHLAVVWQASQPAAVPSARLDAMRSRNCPLCGSVWHAAQLRSSKWKGMTLSAAWVMPTLWQSLHGTAMCAPVSGNLVSLCFAIVNRTRWKSWTVWQASQRLLKGAAAN